MAQTSSKRRSSAAGRSRSAPAKKTARGAARQAAHGRSQSASKPVSRVARGTAKKLAKLAVRRAVRSGAGAVRTAVERTTASGRDVLEGRLEGLNRRPPIQVSIDVAVPPRVAFAEWLDSTTLIEGVHLIEDIEREGDCLIGTVAGPRGHGWRAEIVDERQDESFAWRSLEGSDCAGLVTFHRLSDRLTRIELDLDVLPTSLPEALALSLNVARRRAETDLCRFKAHVEFINPDAYEADLPDNGDSPAREADSQKGDPDD